MGDLPAPLALLGMEFLTYRLILGKGFNTVGALWPLCVPCVPLEPEEPAALGHLQHWHPQTIHRSQRPGRGEAEEPSMAAYSRAGLQDILGTGQGGPSYSSRRAEREAVAGPGG